MINTGRIDNIVDLLVNLFALIATIIVGTAIIVAIVFIIAAIVFVFVWAAAMALKTVGVIHLGVMLV